MSRQRQCSHILSPGRQRQLSCHFQPRPGPEPELPQRPAYSAGNWLENDKKAEKATSVHALWKVCGLAATCRALGVKRVFGSYNGGGDESFTPYHGVEMSDGHVIPASSALRTMADRVRGEPRGIDYAELVENAVSALMGTYDAGEFTLHGVVIIDLDACTITDEKNIDVVLGDKMPWEV
jgi:hypothetical protein